MNEKYLKLEQMLRESVSRIINSSAEYNGLLKTAAHNYRMDFKNAVVAFAQNAADDLLLTYDQWQLYGRVPKRYSKATLLFDNTSGRYVVTFKSSSTTVDKRVHQHRDLLFFQFRNTPDVLEAIKDIYNSDDDSLRDIFMGEAVKRFESFVSDGSRIEFMAKSVTNMLMSRFGEEMPYNNLMSAQSMNSESLEQDFQKIMDVFRAEYSDLAKGIPKELERLSRLQKEVSFQDSERITNVKDFSRYTPVMQNYLKLKAENPDTVVLFQLGDFYEAMGSDAQILSDSLNLIKTSRALTPNGDERIDLCGLPRHRLETYTNMLLDRGYDVGISSVENGERKYVKLTSDRSHEPIQSEPIGRIDYLNKDGSVESSIEYTNPTLLKKDIQEDNRFENMAVYVYRDSSGKTIPHGFIDNLKPPLSRFEIVDKPLEQSEYDFLINRAQEIISDYMKKEFGSDSYKLPEDLSNISLAYTTTEDELHEITAIANLVEFRIETKIDDMVVHTDQYSSLQDIVYNGLDGVTFDDLIYVTDEEFLNFKNEPIENTNTSDGRILRPGKIPTEETNFVTEPEKPVLQLTQNDIDNIIVMKPNKEDGKLRIYSLISENKPENEVVRQIKKEYEGNGRTARTENGLSAFICGNSGGVWVSDYHNVYAPQIVSYMQLYKRVKELISANKYLTKAEIGRYNAEYNHESDALPSLRDIQFSYKIGDTVYISGTQYTVSSIDAEGVSVYQSEAPLFAQNYDTDLFREILIQNIDENKSLIVKPTTSYELYQLSDTEQAHPYYFLSRSELENQKLSIKPELYEMVYSGELEETESLESLYEKFNIHHPDDFFGRSMSVSDIVILKKGNESTAYYCDSIGFSEIKNFLIKEKLTEFILFHPDKRAVSWIYYNPDGNLGSGQIVHETVNVDELTAHLSEIAKDNITEFFAMHGEQKEIEIINPDNYTDEYYDYLEEQSYGKRIEWQLNQTDEEFAELKDSIEDFARASKVMGKPMVVIDWSEHPALREFTDSKEQLKFSFASALLGRLDILENAKRENPSVGYYYKTGFFIYSSDDGVELNIYEGRYDLADGEGSIFTHIEKYKEFSKEFSKKANTVFDSEKYDKLLNLLKTANTDYPLTEDDNARIESIVTKDYGLDSYDDVDDKKNPDYSRLIDKEVNYSDKTFRVVSVNSFGQAHLSDISSVSVGLVPVDTVLPVDTVINLIDAQEDKNSENYVITDNAIGIGTASQRFKNNISAIRVLKTLNNENRAATAAEQKILAQYVGWGGLSDCFNEKHSRYQELKSLLSEQDYRSAYDSTLTSFYTPPIVVKSIYTAISNMGFTNGTILDPACGTGHFFGMLPDNLSASKLYGVELDNISGQIARALYPKANIKIQGFEDANIPDNFIDVAVGNVPFGDLKVFDKRYNRFHLLIHDYFFIKTLDKVRPGGIVAFVTSKGTLDKQNTRVREMMAERAELLGAIRLPNTTFKAAAGTDVTSDILFLQKRTEATVLKEHPDWVYTTENSDGISINSYFVSHPEMILGRMVMQTSRFGMESACVPNGSISLGDELNRAIQNIKGKYIPYTASNEEDKVVDSIEADEAARNYSFYVKDDKLYYRENGVMFASPYTGKKSARIKAMVNLTDITRNLIESEVSGASDEAVEKIRSELNHEYDNFYNDYGSLNSFANAVFKSDNSYPLLCSLEVIKSDDDELIVSKADIFRKRTIAPHTEITSAENSEEALIISMSQRGRVDLEYMSGLTGDSVEKIIAELNGSSIFLKPYESEYVTADEYLSGNVREKLKTAQMAAKEDKKYQVNVEALETVIPKDIPASEISVRLGTTWIPVKYYNDFLIETFNQKNTNITVQFNSLMGNYYVTGKTYDNYSVESVNKYGIKERNGYKILEDSLNLKVAEVRKTIYVNGEEKSVIDKEKTVLAQSKQQLLMNRFKEWIFSDSYRRRDLERLYNDNFNCIVPRQYDGSHLTFPGKNPNITLREHQLNAIARMLYGGNTLLAHQVGAGKTFEMIAGAMKLKELGLVHKSLICVPKHLTAQTGAEFMRLFPAANILVAEEKDFTPQNRKRFLTRIATGDYDAIIIGHTQLEKIPLKPDTQIEIFNRQLDEIVDALSIANKEGAAGATVKSLAKTKKSVERKLKELKERAAVKDNVICFEELGVDQIFIDEAHLFKNLYIYTKMSNVAGIGSGKESGRASDLYSKICYLNQINPGKGVVFATGTPIANTMSEMFTMQRYLQPQMLQAMGLMNFDSWATTFGETVTALEIAPEGNGYRSKTRFAKFNNIPELMSMFKEVADVQTSETLKLPVPDVVREIVEVQPTEKQREMIELLGERAEIIRGGNVDSHKDNILKIISDGKAIALDPRILGAGYSGGMKVDACAKKVFDIWSTCVDKTQIVFCDLSTPTKNSKATKEFSVYDELKARLCEFGVPEDQVQFIQNYKSSKSKQRLFSDVRKGKVRILIGSTEMMGTGMNVQQKLVALHHLDCPNRPADIEQREGRIIRQGNENSTVHIFNYVTKGTFDAFMYQMVERKQKFISSVMTAKHFSERSADDIDEATLNYGQIKAVASDNPLVMKKFEIDNKVNQLSAVRNDFINECRQMEDEVQIYLPARIHKLKTLVDNYKEDLKFALSNPEPNEFDIIIQGKHYNKRNEAVEAIGQQKSKLNGNELLEIGSYRGFRLYLYQEGVGTVDKLCLTVKHNLGYRVNINLQNGIGNIIRLNNVINHDISEKFEETSKELALTEQRLSTAKKEINQSFPQETEYQALLKEQAEINAQLTVGDDKKSGGESDVAGETNSSSADIQVDAPTKPRIRR